MAGVPCRIVRNFGILKTVLSFPMRSDQYSAGPFELRRISAAIMAMGMLENTNSKRAKAISNRRFMTSMTIRGCNTTLLPAATPLLPLPVNKTHNLFQTDWYHTHPQPSISEPPGECRIVSGLAIWTGSGLRPMIDPSVFSAAMAASQAHRQPRPQFHAWCRAGQIHCIHGSRQRAMMPLSHKRGLHPPCRAGISGYCHPQSRQTAPDPVTESAALYCLGSPSP